MITHMDVMLLIIDVLRKDCKEESGGVFFATKSSLCLIEEPSLNDGSEMVWEKLKSKPIHLCSSIDYSIVQLTLFLDLKQH